MGRSIYSVGQINAYIKNMFTQDYLLGAVSVRGEVSNCKYHSSGHIYFTLKDEKAVLQAVMFAGNRGGLSFTLKEGQRVIVTGAVNIYERDGKYQLYAKQISRDGVGSLYEQFAALKKELSERGLFAEEYKQPIPRYIKTLGIVTADTGAAVRDIINISHRRNPYVELYLYPAKVQGEGAADTIVAGIEALERFGVDCMIVGRGGGSMEDLWAFNEEKVAQAIFDCSVPVISAVGHETDFTIADFVADLRAPTPSAAAELAVFEYQSFLAGLSEERRRLEVAMRRRLAFYEQELERRKLRVGRFRPDYQMAEKRLRLDACEDRLTGAMERKLREAVHRLELYAGRLKACSPLDRITGGYAFVTREDGNRLLSASEVSAGERLTLQLSDGIVRVQVTDTQTEEPFMGDGLCAGKVYDAANSQEG
ncbi:exodeoxyribonuclease VII large subunit [Fusibacillus kribbianus]|uniref:Exodeoxyribonuclease 7 large subunit n=1 Tax=Fusibacillus kribbianus TaxID=3044208 RepID=A0AAP4B7L0_9FIRM|nr:exodeoxyribonuclease VII large subunit [Ruminococcus sp. YH-rum2234]MDI9241351.1 exodeoxyribonuclease VII large subunit [Ruminococcus sp. YH-rum2234]